MSLRHLLQSTAVLLACCVPAASASASAAGTADAGAVESRGTIESVQVMPVDGKLVIEPDGSVASYSITTPITPSLRALLDGAIPKWRFEPVVIDGVARRAESRMRISLVASKAGADYQVRIDNVVFPNPGAPVDAASTYSGAALSFSNRRMSPPQYPRDLLRGGISGRVLLGLHFGPEGKVDAVVPVQSMLYDVRGPQHSMARAIKQFEQAAVAAAGHWTVATKAPPGRAMTARDYTVLNSVEFLVFAGPLPKKGEAFDLPAGRWLHISRTGKRPIPWLAGADATTGVGVADLADGEVIALAGAPRLQPAAGTAF